MAMLWTVFTLIVFLTFGEPHRGGLEEQKRLEETFSQGALSETVVSQDNMSQGAMSQEAILPPPPSADQSPPMTRNGKMDEDLQTIIESYVLREKQGVGMVINLVNFNKEGEYALIYVTFFDIATREIMFAAEVSGNAGGSGMTKHWASGVEVAFRKMFIDQIYKPKNTLNHQIPSKLRLY